MQLQISNEALIGKWGKIPYNSSYFNKNLDPSEKNEKDLLTNVFNNSFAVLNANVNSEKLETEALIETAKLAHLKFSVAYQKQSLIKKVLIVVFGILGYSLAGAYIRFIDKLAEKTAENFKGNLKDLVDLRVKSCAFREQFLEKVINVAMKNILNRPDSKGVIYKITNEKGVESYLVGTVHIASKHMVENKNIAEKVKKCEELIEELDGSLNTRLVYWNLSLNPFNKFKYCVDTALLTIAREKKIKIFGLETHQNQLIALNIANDRVNKYPLWERSPEVFHRTENHTGLILQNELVEAWQNGDDEDIEFMLKMMHPELVKHFIYERNKQWLSDSKIGDDTGLIDKLTNTEKSICIAVGALHCYGEEGLVEQFREAGFTVTRE